MKAERTIRQQLRALQQGLATLQTIAPIDRCVDQSYGAAEALRWVLGEGPYPAGLLTPLHTTACGIPAVTQKGVS